MGVRRCVPSTILRPEDICDIRITTTGNEFDKYPAKSHARKTALKLEESAGLIYLAGQPTINWGDSDQPRTFRQRRYFYYITGVDEADCYVTYDIQNDLLTLYVPDFDLHRAIWMGPTLTVEEAQQRYDVDRVRYYASLPGDIQAWANKYNDSSPIYILHDTQKPNIPTNKNLRLDDARLLPAMNLARMVKDEYEIRMIRHANRISGLAHRKILEDIHLMSNETEIEGSFLDTCVSHGAKHQSYEIIAGSGENAAVLHYVKNDDPLEGRQLVCLDAGAEWNCYASDVTRTIPLGRDWPSERARDIYHIVEDIQEQCIRFALVGRSFSMLQQMARFYTVKGLWRLGILQGGNLDEICKSGAASVFFPHGLGHHVGLEVHDVTAKSNTALDQSTICLGGFGSVPADYSQEENMHSNSEAFEDGMVITVEPGIYFSRLALENACKQPLARYINFEEAEKYISVGGVRIEDDILITRDGPENLTTAPKGEEMMEIIRRGFDST
ncbi:hypothetical protein EYZ11_002221 [Aspergillus tanneri]|uniref:Xaa-Pro aminopeptidase n=1 Tax=Aspergillus tanneri TaxID=1220188 RepID=A0A4S3JT75_9EURO|nr:uncharacterized protein ATNIH1004_000477 [Aspergillus tanneri]KAA8651587.1 hypothetical protein ATNIH1004_000477 [Aspergillus tanneri]THC98288.1 hypothetical protein EYZ11_002221 [Aspergillus tanneri]